MSGAPLSIVVMALLMAVMAGGFGAAWVVHRLTKPSVDRAASICVVMLGPVGAVGLFLPQWFSLSLLWIAGVLLAILQELSRIDRHSKGCGYEYRWPAEDGARYEVLTAEERKRFYEEIDRFREEAR